MPLSKSSYFLQTKTLLNPNSQDLQESSRKGGQIKIIEITHLFDLLKRGNARKEVLLGREHE
jgi:hypothetical protein